MESAVVQGWVVVLNTHLLANLGDMTVLGRNMWTARERNFWFITTNLNMCQDGVEVKK